MRFPLLRRALGAGVMLFLVSLVVGPAPPAHAPDSHAQARQVPDGTGH